MEGQKYCVYNQTRESFLSLGVAVADGTAGPLRGLIEKLTVKADSGLWMMPYRGIPPAHGLSPIDLVYLDNEYRVIQEVESFPTSTVEPLKDQAASALALPTHTIYSSQTQPGDQLVICVAAEMERRLEKLSGSLASSSAADHTSAKVEHPNRSEPDAGPFANHSHREPTFFMGSDTMTNFEPQTNRPNSLMAWLRNWLSSDRRRAYRQPLPGLVAYYWTGSAPRAYQIADISTSGFYVLTEERWFPGTMVLMTLQRTDSSGQTLEDSIAVQSRVVRWGSDGLGLAFVVSRGVESGGDAARQHGADRKTLDQFLARLKDTSFEIDTANR